MENTITIFCVFFFFIVIIGFISLLKPISSLKIKTRTSAFWVFIIGLIGSLASLIILGGMVAPAQNEPAAREASAIAAPPPLALNSPSDEEALITVVNQAREKYRAAPNDMAKGGVRVWRKQAICNLLPSLSVTNWKGKIYELSSNSDGNGVVTIKISSYIYLETWNNSLSDIGDNTLIDPNSELFQKLSAMKKGDVVRFSGDFIESDTDCIEEHSLTQEGSMLEPEFIFRFSSLSAQ